MPIVKKWVFVLIIKTYLLHGCFLRNIFPFSHSDVSQVDQSCCRLHHRVYAASNTNNTTRSRRRAQCGLASCISTCPKSLVSRQKVYRQNGAAISCAVHHYIRFVVFYLLLGICDRWPAAPRRLSLSPPSLASSLDLNKTSIVVVL